MKPNRFQVQRERLAAEGPHKWLATLAPKVERLRQQLAQRDARAVALASGAQLDDTHTLRVRLWDKDYTLTFPECVVRNADGTPARTDRQALVLMYLQTADGAPVAHHWLRYRELPGGLFYAYAFHGYAERRLAQAFHNCPEAFREAALRCGGVPLTFGAAYAFEFVALPRIHLAAVLWSGDEDFASNALILFDAAVSHYLPADVAGALGSQLVSRLMGVPDDVGQTLTALAVQPPTPPLQRANASSRLTSNLQ
jgi:hypothetical protein